MLITHFYDTESAYEHRMLSLFKEVGPNAKEWYDHVSSTYIATPMNAQNYPQAALGAGMTVVSAGLELPDYLIAGALDYEIDAPEGTFGRTRRDVSQLFQNVITLHPIRAVTDAIRLATTDVIVDMGAAMSGLE